MRRNLFYLILLSFFFTCLSGCKSDSASAGTSLLEEEDQILVRVDTFPIQSDLVICDSIISLPDSFMLGEMESSYGTLRAEILTQFACPTGFKYPEDATVDSVCLCLCYRTWFGDGNTPISIDAYEMDLATLDYATSYATNTNVREFVSSDAPSILAHEKVVVAASKKDSAYSQVNSTYYPMVRARASEEFTKRFFAIRDFSSQEAFNELFKGIYIRSDFGSSTILNIVDMNISVYYSFSYNKAGRDTLVTDVKTFYANSEVRQVNCIDYRDKQEVYETLRADSLLYDYVLAPANIYTRVQLPMSKIQERIESRIDGKRPYVNMARIRVDVCNMRDKVSTRDDWAQPASKMLLIKESSMNRFFSMRELPSDTCAILSDLATSTNEDGETIYLYTYDLSALLTRQLRYTNNPDTLNMVLVPVDVITATSNGTEYIISIKQQQTVSATVTYSAKNIFKPKDVEVVYSGF